MTENKFTFHARIAPYFSPSDQLDVRLAYSLAKFGHRAQTRKELVEGKPTRYFEHVRRAALILMDEVKIMDKNMIISSLLHDSVEDTQDLSPELIEHCFGDEVSAMVNILSKVPKEGYIERLRGHTNWKPLAVKGCDKLDNLRSLMVPGTTLEFQKKQVKEVRAEYYPIFERLLNIIPAIYKPNVSWLRDEIIKTTEKAGLLVELQEMHKTNKEVPQ